MKSYLLLAILCGSLLIEGCATVGPVKGVASSNVIYTDASKEVAFDASREALLKLGYEIGPDTEHFYITAHNPNFQQEHVTARIQITQEVAGAKIVYCIDYINNIQQPDLFGIYQFHADSIYNELSKILTQKGYKLQKSW